MPPVSVKSSCWAPVSSACHFAVEVASMRHTSSLFFSSAKVCSGFDGANGLLGYTPPTARRSTKLGVVGYTRYVLVLVLSLFEMPRFDRLWTTSRLTLTLKAVPST